MRVMTLLGTRPEIIRLSRIIEGLDAVCDHVLVHTGQNYDPSLNEVFFEQLGVRKPDHFLEAGGTLAEQIGGVLRGCERLLGEQHFDRFVVLGDTNSALGAIVAKRLAVPVYHLEAGNRCFDDRVPEEINRRIIDHSSDVLMPYTERSRQNLLREGIAGNRIFVTGNPIYEVIQYHEEGIAASRVLDELKLSSGAYLLVTMHRAENVDPPDRLARLASGLDLLQREMGLPVVVSTHPRTRDRMQAAGIGAGADVRFLEPFPFFEFVRLEREARCVLSDSGTVQEECAIFGVPNVTIRDVTERPETIEVGSGILSGADPDSMLACVRLALARGGDWQPPAEYLVPNVSRAALKIIVGYRRANS